MGSKAFKATKGEPVSFTLGGTYLADGDGYTQGQEFETEPFECRPRIPAGIMLRFAEIIEGDTTGGEESAAAAAMESLRVVTDLFAAALQPVDAQRFDATINAADLGIDIDVLTDVATWLMGEYSARPTGPDSAAGSPAPLSGKTSTPGGPSTAYPTYSRPDPATLTAPVTSPPPASAT